MRLTAERNPASLKWDEVGAEVVANVTVPVPLVWVMLSEPLPRRFLGVAKFMPAMVVSDMRIVDGAVWLSAPGTAVSAGMYSCPVSAGPAGTVLLHWFGVGTVVPGVVAVVG